MKPRRNSRHRWVDYYYLITDGKSTKNIWNRQIKTGKFWNKWLFYALKHKNEGLRNEKERKGMKRNDIPESIGINRKMTGNDRNYERITTKNDRKRPETTAGSPFGSATSRNGFLGNSPIFLAFSSKILRFSLIFPNFLRFSLKFSDYFPNFAVFLHYNIY